MSDLRELLDEAAGPPAGPADLHEVKRRARRQQVLRAGAAVAVVVAVVAVAVSTLVLDRTQAPPVIDPPDGTRVEQAVPMRVPDGLTVEATAIRPFPEAWSNSYVAIAVVRNEHGDTAVQVGGELSLHTATGRGIGTAAPAPATILPGQRGLLIKEPVDLPEELGDDPRLGLDLQILAQVDDPTVPEVAVGDIDYQTDPPRGCTTSGTVDSSWDAEIDGLRVAMIGYVDGALYTGDVADLRPLPVGGSMPFRIQTTWPTGCPSGDAFSDLQVLVEYPLELIQPTS